MDLCDAARSLYSPVVINRPVPLRVLRDLHGPPPGAGGSVVCVGAFDGLHRGHRAVLTEALASANARGLAFGVVTFEPIPRIHFRGRGAVRQLSSVRERLATLSAWSIDWCALLRFNDGLAGMSAADFGALLGQRFGAREVRVGSDFRFGRGREGDIAALVGYGAEHGFEVREVGGIESSGGRVSATRVRDALAEGDLAQAAALLGRNYSVQGHVVRGQQLGRKLGYPTANLRRPTGLAADGIFAVRVHGIGLDNWPGVASAGTRPTVGGREPLVEVHLFDFDGDLYGRLIEVEFVARRRGELRFESLDAMLAVMHEDARWAREVLGCAGSAHAADA